MASVKIEIDGLTEEEARNLKTALERIQEMARNRRTLEGQRDPLLALQKFVSQFVSPNKRGK